MCSFKRRWNLAIFSTDLTLEGSIFQRISGAAEKSIVPILVYMLGTYFLTGHEYDNINECK